MVARGSEYSEESYQNSTEEEESFELKVGLEMMRLEVWELEWREWMTMEGERWC